jgi:hypothetical protein
MAIRMADMHFPDIGSDGFIGMIFPSTSFGRAYQYSVHTNPTNGCKPTP